MAHDNQRRDRFLSGLRRCLKKTQVANDRKNGLKEFVHLVLEDFHIDDYPELSGTIEQVDLARDTNQILIFHAQGDEDRCVYLLIFIGKTLGVADPAERSGNI